MISNLYFFLILLFLQFRLIFEKYEYQQTGFLFISLMFLNFGINYYHMKRTDFIQFLLFIIYEVFLWKYMTIYNLLITFFSFLIYGIFMFSKTRLIPKNERTMVIKILYIILGMIFLFYGIKRMIFNC